MEDRTNSLCVASFDGHSDLIQRLLQNNLNVQVLQERWRQSSLNRLGNGHDRTVKLLIKNGTNNSLTKNDEISPLFIACENGHDS